MNKMISRSYLQLEIYSHDVPRCNEDKDTAFLAPQWAAGFASAGPCPQQSPDTGEDDLS